GRLGDLLLVIEDRERAAAILLKRRPLRDQFLGCGIPLLDLRGGTRALDVFEPQIRIVGSIALRDRRSREHRRECGDKDFAQARISLRSGKRWEGARRRSITGSTRGGRAAQSPLIFGSMSSG